MKPICVVHYNIDGSPTFLFHGDVQFLVIDERAPEDRVYEISEAVESRIIDNLIAGGQIGIQNDARHQIFAHRILKAQEGKRHLEMVKAENPL